MIRQQKNEAPGSLLCEPPDFFPEGKEPDECVYYNDSDCFICVYKNGDQLLLDAYHPGARFSEEKKEFYVNSLIDTIRKYKP